MSGPAAGALYESKIPGSPAVQLVVLSEDSWNEHMSDSVAVPIYADDAIQPNLFAVETGPGMRALCTRAQNIPHDYFGPWLGLPPEEAWVRIRIGVRRYLDIDARVAKRPRVKPRSARTDWWPPQNTVHFADQPEIPTDKLFGVVSDDAWNSRPAAKYCATVRLTSQTKDWRKRWEVPVSDGWVVSGDLYSTAYARFEQGTPDPSKYPTRLSADESADIAGRQKHTLTLA